MEAGIGVVVGVVVVLLVDRGVAGVTCRQTRNEPPSN